GDRRPRHQVVGCPACGRPVFVLPGSPWPPPGTLPQAPPPGHPPLPPPPVGGGGGGGPRGFWPGPRRAGAPQLPVLLLLSLGVRPYLAPRPRGAASEAPPPSAGEVHERMAAGRRALADGNFHVAARHLNQAVQHRDRWPGLLSGPENRWLDQLQRQGDLLAR